MLRPYIPFRGILSPIYALPPPITRKNDGIPAKSVTRPPRRDHRDNPARWERNRAGKMPGRLNAASTDDAGDR